MSQKLKGTGYNLTIVKEDWCNELYLVAELKKLIPEAVIRSSLATQLVINLPNKNTDQFPELFRMLEMNRSKFNIKGIGVSCTTIEDVFLRY